VYKKIVVRLQNVVAFYELYPSEVSGFRFQVSGNVLDQWVFARFAELVSEVEAGMGGYELDRATRPFMLFIDDLSTWYLRRSRDRLKGKDGEDEDTNNARGTLRHVLLELSKTLAPFMPFLAEDVYKRVGGEMESVHLEHWDQESRIKNQEPKIIEDMNEARLIASVSLEQRANSGIKVRQPLQSLFIKYSDPFSSKWTEQLQCLIKDEVNVKEILFNSTEHIVGNIALNTEITPELKEEGMVREFIRQVQELRKKEDLNPADRDRTLLVSTDETGKTFVQKFETEIKKATLFSELGYGESGEEEKTKIENILFSLAIKK
jgi:isoleucyl-tRNA synthetase